MEERAEQYQLTFAYNFIKGNLHLSLGWELQSQRQFEMELRGALVDDLVIPFARGWNYSHFFKVQAASMWNHLPNHIRKSPSLTCFKKRLLKHQLMSRYDMG
eukprot:GHVN01061374.1.p1 GENE.GHVN01061374.1~~GHVN01061374.1.p1  ORF type:complete len:102 (+),score=12.35 GHVN01061374.1:838-1143(+)